MKSKTSFFNKAIYKKNLSLFWPIWGAYFLYELFTGPLYLWFHFGKERSNKLEILLGSIGGKTDIVAIAIASLIVGMALFNYLFTSKSANMIHAMPLTRLELYGTNLFSGFTFLFVPQLVSFFFSVLVCLANGVAEVQYLGIWFLACLGMSFFFFSIVVLCVMLTGQLFALPIYFVICNLFVEGIITGISLLTGMMAYGVSGTSLQGGSLRCLSPILYLMDQVKLTGRYSIVNNRGDYELTEIQMHGGGAVVCYAVVAILFYALAYYGYKKREIECAGDLLTFSWLKPLFRWGAGVCFGFLGGTLGMYFLRDMVENLPFVAWPIMVVMIGMFIFFFAEMLIQKSVHVVSKRRCKECGVFIVFMALAFSGIYLYGYSSAHHIPDVDEVQYAYVDMNYPVEFEGEDIAQVLELQKEILQQQSVIKEELEMNEAVNGSGYVTITYRMKDGSVLTRNYTLPSGAEVSTEMFRRIYEWESQADSFLRQFIEYDYESVSRVTDAQLEWYDSSTTNYMYRSVEGDGARALFDAAIADAQAGVLQKYNLTDYREPWDTRTSESYATIDIYYYHAKDNWQSMYDRMNGITENTNSLVDNSSNIYVEDSAMNLRSGMYVCFGEDCTNIIHVLVECGLIESADELEYISDDIYY